MDELTKAEFLADFFCSPLAKEVYKSLPHLDNFKDVVSSLSSFAEKLWNEINVAIEEDEGDESRF